MTTQIKERIASSREAEAEKPLKTPTKNASKTVEFENSDVTQLQSGTEFNNF